MGILIEGFTDDIAFGLVYCLGTDKQRRKLEKQHPEKARRYHRVGCKCRPGSIAWCLKNDKAPFAR